MGGVGGEGGSGVGDGARGPNRGAGADEAESVGVDAESKMGFHAAAQGLGLEEDGLIGVEADEDAEIKGGGKGSGNADVARVGFGIRGTGHSVAKKRGGAGGGDEANGIRGGVGEGSGLGAEINATAGELGGRPRVLEAEGGGVLSAVVGGGVVKIAIGNRDLAVVAGSAILIGCWSGSTAGETVVDEDGSFARHDESYQAKKGDGCEVFHRGDVSRFFGRWAR